MKKKEKSEKVKADESKEERNKTKYVERRKPPPLTQPRVFAVQKGKNESKKKLSGWRKTSAKEHRKKKCCVQKKKMNQSHHPPH